MSSVFDFSFLSPRCFLEVPTIMNIDVCSVFGKVRLAHAIAQNHQAIKEYEQLAMSEAIEKHVIIYTALIVISTSYGP